MNIELKPHLKDAEVLYKRISSFESAVHLENKYNPLEGARHYSREDARAVIHALSECLDFHPGQLGDLEHALYSGDIDFMSLVQEDHGMPEEEYRLLYIVSRPFFRSMKDTVKMDDMFWADGRCPVCSAIPSLSLLQKESQRTYFCSFCGTSGNYKRIGCPACLTDDPRNITIITLEGEEGMRADTCEKCRKYVKNFEGSMMEEISVDLLDIMSIPLDIVVQEKGFTRLAPTPLGMVKLTGKDDR